MQTNQEPERPAGQEVGEAKGPEKLEPTAKAKKRAKEKKKKRRDRRKTENYTTANALRRGTRIRKGKSRDTIFMQVEVVGHFEYCRFLYADNSNEVVSGSSFVVTHCLP